MDRPKIHSLGWLGLIGGAAFLMAASWHPSSAGSRAD